MDNDTCKKYLILKIFPDLAIIRCAYLICIAIDIGIIEFAVDGNLFTG